LKQSSQSDEARAKFTQRVANVRRIRGFIAPASATKSALARELGEYIKAHCAEVTAATLLKNESRAERTLEQRQ